MKKIFLALALFSIFNFQFSISHAQINYSETNNLFYHALRTPQSNIDNMAFFPTNNTFYIMLPGADIQLGSPIGVNNFLRYDKKSQNTLIDINTIFDNMSEKNNFRLAANVNLLGFGFKVNNMFFTFNTRIVSNLSFGFPKSTVDAILQGNITETGAIVPEVEMLNGDILNVTSYLETSLGMGYKFEDLGLTVGGRVKLLGGIANIQTDNTKIVFNTEDNVDSVSARMYYEIHLSTFAPYDTNKHQFVVKMGDVFSNLNTGLAFDLGAKYEMGPFTFSLAINDLTAGIHWKNNVSTWTPEGGQGLIEFNGLDVSTILNNGTFNIDSVTTYIRDQISSMTPSREDAGDYWFPIPTKINLGASYSFAKILRAGLLFHGQLDRGLLCKSSSSSGFKQSVSNTFRFNTTLTLGANFYNWAEVIVGNSLVSDGSTFDPFNPGIGIILTPFTIAQLYFMADYISNFYLIESKAVNLKFGLNILIGKGDRTKIEAVKE